MKRPYTYLTRMILFLAAVGAACGVLYHGLLHAFMANPPLNGLILGVLVLGIAYNFRQVLLLNPEADWLDAFKRNHTNLSGRGQPRLLGAMATMLGERKGNRLSLSAISMRTILDGIAARLDESRDISRYLICLLVFLGLLGTFWGLLETVGAVSQTIGSLSASTDVGQLFADLQNGLKAPLSGMGTAFGTSFLGLAGSLVLGFLELQVGQAHNRFYMDLEEYLSGLTRLSTGALSESEQPIPAYIQALLEQTADGLDGLQRTIARAEEGRGAANTALTQLVDRMNTLTEQMRTEQTLMSRLAESQIEMKALLQRFAEAGSGGGFGIDEASRHHLRNLDGLMSRLVEETQASRVEVVTEFRNEIRLLARTIAALAEEPR